MGAGRLDRTHLCPVLLLAASGAAAAQDAADLTPSGDQRTPPDLQVVEPRADAAQNARRLLGRIAARETVPLSFAVGGRLMEFPVLEDPRVGADALVARLDQGPSARAVERAERAPGQAERASDRVRRLAASNVASEVRAEDARTARDLADMGLRDAREALTDSVPTAPFDGIVAHGSPRPSPTPSPAARSCACAT